MSDKRTRLTFSNCEYSAAICYHAMRPVYAFHVVSPHNEFASVRLI